MKTQAIKEVKKSIETEDLGTEKENDLVWLERKSFRIALISTFTALSVVVGYLLAIIPNIELFTLMIFLSGFILGKRDGMVIGFFSSFIFCFFNPFGPSPLPLLAFQLFHYSLTGLWGGLLSNYFRKKDFYKKDGDLFIFPVMVIFGFLGALITIFFQIFSSLTSVLSIFGTINEFLPYFLSGIIFTIIHIIGNTLGFIFILPGLIPLINKMLY
ncbi:hypothetical protein LCGC14_0865740 [marine sediment metagenome]|uniref:ECF transporter S component n=1 Tax=marine sediment metagenome TaxID=412755 RepID=A0A0F9SD68_9ZZZZ